MIEHCPVCDKDTEWEIDYVWGEDMDDEQMITYCSVCMWPHAISGPHSIEEARKNR